MTAMQRLGLAMAAFARAMGDGWVVVEGEPYPVLGVGESDGYRRVALIHEILGSRGVELPHRRGPDIAVEHQARRPTLRRGLEVWSQGGHWRWLVDDGKGLLRTAQGASLQRALEVAWSVLWEMTVDPLELVVELLSREAGEPWHLGTPHVGSGRVWWGTIDIIVTPTDSLVADHENWPLVRHERLVRHVRERCYPGELAARLAGLALGFARRNRAPGLHDDSRSAPGPGRAVKAPFSAAGSYCAVPISPPPLPAEVCELSGVIGSMVDDWRSRLRSALGDESQRVWEERKGLIDERAPLVIALPGEGLDEFGRELRDGRPSGNARLEVPVEVVAALWALGLPLRAISEVTTGRDTSRNTVHRWVKGIRSAHREWTRWVEAGELVDLLDLGSATAPCHPTGQVVQRVSRRRAVLVPRHQGAHRVATALDRRVVGAPLRLPRCPGSPRGAAVR